MNILAIETSCDETAIAVIEARGSLHGAPGPHFRVKASTLISQISVHKKFGGVFPAVAKREHAINLIPVFIQALKKAGLYRPRRRVDMNTLAAQAPTISRILEREPMLLERFLETIPLVTQPEIHAIAVTFGPGLEPALWVGINFAKALSYVWNIPLIPVNHMHGHIAAAIFDIQKTARVKAKKAQSHHSRFPVLALLISGGHTELVLMEDWMKFKILGETRDDAAGEAFDKVARMLSLSYPGGPQISALAEEARRKKLDWKKYMSPLPRPMITSTDYDFSFSGLKTAALYSLRAQKKITHMHRMAYALELENSIADVLLAKTKKALAQTGARTLVISGGVSANTHVRKSFRRLVRKEFPSVDLRIPSKTLSTDNATMIALAGYITLAKTGAILTQAPDISAKGNVRLDSNDHSLFSI